MAFVFLVEDGTGLTEATSYVSVSDADDYMLQNTAIFDDWDLLDQDVKEKVLSWSSRYLDQHARWNGVKTVETSGLRWPRTGVCDIDGLPIGPNTIPYQLEDATVELASYLMIDDISRPRGQDGLDRLRVDVIELYFNSNYRFPSIPSSLNLILSGLGTLIGNSGGFGRIRRA